MMISSKVTSYKVSTSKMKVLIILLSLSSVLSIEIPTVEKFFKKFGQYEIQNENGVSGVKSYYLSRDLELNWINAFVMCRAFNMDLVELPTEAEADYFLTACEENVSPDNYYLIGASYVGVGLNDFYWMTTGKRINYTLKYIIGQPDNYENIEKFLSIKKESEDCKFNDISIKKEHKFICQSITNLHNKSSVASNVSYSMVNGTESIMPQCNPAMVEWFPHPYNCKKFILCFHGNSIEKSCAPNLQFSAEQGKCILSQTECCPDVDDVLNPVFMADRNDCSKYSVCFSGKAIERSCAEGLFFDVDSNWCTLPENVTCDARTSNTPTVNPLFTIEPSFCKWYGNVIDRNSSYIKSLCYHDKETTHEEASINCKKHGMRLMRIENSSVQTATLDYLKLMFGSEINGEYHVSGRSVNGSWYHDDNTQVYAKIPWRAGKVPEPGCLVLRDVIPMEFTSYLDTKKLHSICEFIQVNKIKK